MALTATVYRIDVTLSDVDRGVYETLELRLARHPSESLRYFVTRTLAFCLEYEDGIAFSKGGISSAEVPPVAIHDATGSLRAWIDVGSPSTERLHKAAKAAGRVALYTCTDVVRLRRDATSGGIHRPDAIAVWRLDAVFVDSIADRLQRTTALEVVRNEEQLYVTIAGAVHETSLVRASLVE